MRIAAKGNSTIVNELKAKLGTQCECITFSDQVPTTVDVIFDLDEPRVEQITAYAQLNVPVVLNTVNIQLEQLLRSAQLPSDLFFGINALPGFLALEKWECCATETSHQATLNKQINPLGIEILWVQSRVGLVTPRILFMIINEAFYTVQEGTASKEHINTGMKLGTNYPGGPFEWVEKIGITEVYNSLKALYEDTGDERYKICPLLKTEYLSAGSY